MRAYLTTLITILSISTVMAEEPSHCKANEKIYFNCQLDNSEKVVSVCSSNDFSESHGYIQYRFGVPEKIELEYPKTKNFNKTLFLYSEIENRNQYGSSYDHILKFKIGIYNYLVHDFHAGWWEKDESSSDPLAGFDRSLDNAYIEVTAKDKTVTMSCNKSFTSNIPDLEKFIECDKDNIFPECINAEQPN